jgi:hypothetical protein
MAAISRWQSSPYRLPQVVSIVSDYKPKSSQHGYFCDYRFAIIFWHSCWKEHAVTASDLCIAILWSHRHTGSINSRVRCAAFHSASVSAGTDSQVQDFWFVLVITLLSCSVNSAVGRLYRGASRYVWHVCLYMMYVHISSFHRLAVLLIFTIIIMILPTINKWKRS